MTHSPTLSGISRTPLIVATVLTMNCAGASIITIQHNDTLIGDRTQNLIRNGSFEGRNGPPGDVSWTGIQGQRLVYSPTVANYSIPSWLATGDPQSYGVWGPFFGDPPGPADGQYEVYFGNYLTTPTSSYSINPNGTIDFTTPPAFVNFSPLINNPVTLSQAVENLDVGAHYWLDFYTTGEFEEGPFGLPGLFGLQISGESLIYLRTAEQNPNSNFGRSERYQIEFTASASSVTLQWLNWGHVCAGSILPSCGSELILDDVILNSHMEIPEPSTNALVGIALIAILCALRPKPQSPLDIASLSRGEQSPA